MEESTPVPHADLIFSLPEYAGAFGVFLSTVINEVGIACDPVLSQIPKETKNELAPAQYSLPSGETLELPSIGVKPQANMNVEAMINGDVGALHFFVYEMAQGIVEGLAPQFFQHVSSVAEAFGQTVDVKGRPFDYDVFLEMMEKMAFDFDEEGNVMTDGNAMFVGSDIFKQIQNLPPQTPEQEQRWKDLVERKREEFNARKRTRRISR